MDNREENTLDDKEYFLAHPRKCSILNLKRNHGRIPSTSLLRPIIEIYPMELRDSTRHQLIEKLMTQHTENVAGAAIDLWERMATQIISIVGTGGFSSLYLRSVFLTRSTYPWLADCTLSAQADSRFADLRMRFAEQAPAQVSAANNLLLITFTDILASLIGEGLTTSILRSAWGNDAPNRAGEELIHE